MRHLSRFILPIGVALVVVPAVSGCIVEERPVVVRRPPPCPGAMFIGGHYGPRGYWHPGHWRCPGVVEVVEVE
jgi:hypothetical protein